MNGTAYRFNPYRTPVDRWSEDARAAHSDMPRTAQGHVIQPKYVVGEAAQRAHTTRWREWSQRWPAQLWPIWLPTWLEMHP